jgi:hypothetical protein
MGYIDDYIGYASKLTSRPWSWRPLPSDYRAQWAKAPIRKNGFAYENAGWALAIHLEDHLGPETIEVLQDSFDDETEFRRLFGKHMRGFLKFVPYTRRDIFYRGVRQAFEEERI